MWEVDFTLFMWVLLEENKKKKEDGFPKIYWQYLFFGNINTLLCDFWDKFKNKISKVNNKLQFKSIRLKLNSKRHEHINHCWNQRELELKCKCAEQNSVLESVQRTAVQTNPVGKGAVTSLTTFHSNYLLLINIDGTINITFVYISDVDVEQSRAKAYNWIIYLSYHTEWNFGICLILYKILYITIIYNYIIYNY